MKIEEDIYEFFGIDREATKEQIKKAYKELVKKLHPDINKAADAQEQFEKCQNFFEILNDECKRAEYDLYGEVSDEIHISRIESLLLQIFNQYLIGITSIEEELLEYAPDVNILEYIEKSLDDSIMSNTVAIEANRLNIEQYKGLQNVYGGIQRRIKVKKKKKTTNIFSESIDRQLSLLQEDIEDCNDRIEMCENSIKNIEKAKKYLNDNFEYMKVLTKSNVDDYEAYKKALEIAHEEANK